MLSLASKTLLALAVAALAIAVGYGIDVGDRAGATILAGVAIAALIAALSLIGSGVRDAPEDPAGEPVPTTLSSADAARPSPWPVLAAVTAAVLGVGLAVGAALVVPAVAVAAVVTLGWVGQSWREHTSWTPRVRERVTFRLLVPAGLPVATFVLVAILAVSVSRVLLAVNKDAASGVALIVALVVLFGCFYLASRPTISPTALMALAAVAGAAVIAAGVVGAAKGERTFHPEHEVEGARLVAANTAFDRKTIELPANQQVQITLVNRDTIPHNFALYSGDQPLQTGPPFSGPGQRVYTLETPAPGSYTFVCEIHPQVMAGKVVVR